MNSIATVRPARKLRTIKVDTLARVEGEGGLLIRMRGDRVEDVKLTIYEPPRLFESFLRGRSYAEPPDITARICGICPVAYQMSAVGAIERAFGIPVDPRVHALRRLLYCGEWIESHALHIYMLHAPDFLGFQDVMEMARDHRPLVEDALRVKKTGNDIVATLGGREIHPVSVAVGGFHRVPARNELDPLVERLKWALDASLSMTKVLATLDFPDFEQDYEFVALHHPGEYALTSGRLVSNRGLDIDPADFEKHFLEQHVRHSNALHSRLRDRGAYLAGPLARYNLNAGSLPEVARQAAADCGLTVPCRNPFKSILARQVELVFACHEALRIIESYEPPPEPRMPVRVRPGSGAAITEAPRGILYHRYDIDAQGDITACKIVPPTAQNLKQMESDLWALIPTLLGRPEEELAWRCEQAIRNYDPCISCATHFLRLRIDRE